MSPEKIFDLVRVYRLAVVATVYDNGMTEAALTGIAQMPDKRIISDTTKHSRKYANLCRRSTVALVVGWEHETTVQLEGVAGEPSGVDLERCKEAYFAAYPDGRERQAWPDVAYIAVSITWMRYSDYSARGSRIVEHHVIRR